MYGYIYKTTNKINNKIYIGQKHSDTFLGNKYLGSGKRLKEAIRKYGKDSFVVELIECVDNASDMDEREIYWISFYHATDKNIGYNLSEGGNVNRTFVGENNPFYGKHHSITTRQKIAEINKNKKPYKHSEKHKEYMRNKMLGRKVTWGNKLSENAKVNPNYGMRNKQVSEETKLLLSIRRKQYFAQDCNRQKMSEVTKNRWTDYEYRKKHCEAMKGKTRKITYKECPICNKMIYSSNLQRHIIAHNKQTSSAFTGGP